MKKDKRKPELYNSYKSDNHIVRVNDFSTITSDLVTQMVSVDFPVHYNCIRVTLVSEPDFLESVLEDFVSFCSSKFTVVLIQRVGFKEALFSLFTSKNLLYISGKLIEFRASHNHALDFRLYY